MLTLVLVALAFIATLALVLTFFSIAAIGANVQRIADNVHVARDGINSLRRGLPTLQTVVDRMELHLRGPSGKYGRPPARISSTDASEIVNGP